MLLVRHVSAPEPPPLLCQASVLVSSQGADLSFATFLSNLGCLVNQYRDTWELLNAECVPFAVLPHPSSSFSSAEQPIIAEPFRG